MRTGPKAGLSVIEIDYSVPPVRVAFQLALLASIPHGIIEDQLALAHGFDRTMIAGLVHEGLATAQREIVTVSRRTTIEVVRIRITDAGRMALQG